MIRIRRGKEPDVLKRNRRKHLARAVLAWSRGASANDETKDGREKLDFSGYEVARDMLYEAQKHKCAYCERLPGLNNQPVEHFRPKAGAVRGDPRLENGRAETDGEHYWWLAWSWSNLFFACTTCNGRGTKGNWFPLQVGTQAIPPPPREALAELPATHWDTSGEQPMLIDPSVEDPMDFIVWLPSNPEEEEWTRLRWLPFGVDDRGEVTIATFKLDRELPDDVSSYIRAHVVPKLLRLERAHTCREHDAALCVWDELEAILEPTMPYLAAVYDSMEWFLEHPRLNGVRFFVGRTLKRPGAVGDDPPPQSIEEPPELRDFPDEVRLKVRAEVLNAAQAILALCEQRSWDAETLRRVLGYDSIETVRSACRKLVEERRLTRMEDGSFRSQLARSSSPPE